MNFPVTGYVVMMHSQDVGTFAPSFSSMDEAEEFSNAMRLVTDGVAISEPVPIVATQSIKVKSWVDQWRLGKSNHLELPDSSIGRWLCPNLITIKKAVLSYG